MKIIYFSALIISIGMIRGTAQVAIMPTQMGINITDPASNVSLHIKDEFEAIRLDGASPFLSFYNGTDYRGYLYMTGDNMYLYNRKAGNVFFGANNTARMTIDSDGNIGIGTTSPEARFHVARGTLTGGNFNGNTIAGFEKSSGNGYISVLTSSSSESGVLFGDETGGAIGGIIYNNPGTVDGLQFRTNGNINRMTIDNNGDVGIGITNAVRPLHIKSRNGGDEYGIMMEQSGSTVRWEMSLFRGNFNWFYNGGLTPVATIATNGTYSSSDRRLKKNIRSYKEVLPLVDQLQVATYQFRTEADNASATLGLIAQDVAKVFPEIVRYEPGRDGEMYYSMDYSKTGVIALKAIQELQRNLAERNEQNQQLQAKVSRLESQNADLQERLAAVEAAISRFEATCCAQVEAIDLDPQGPAVDRAYPVLYQNEPNPFSNMTRIRYFIPPDIQRATLRMISLEGKLLKEVPVTVRGEGAFELNTHQLSPGTYVYALIIDGEVFQSRQMIIGGN